MLKFSISTVADQRAEDWSDCTAFTCSCRAAREGELHIDSFVVQGLVRPACAHLSVTSRLRADQMQVQSHAAVVPIGQTRLATGTLEVCVVHLSCKLMIHIAFVYEISSQFHCLELHHWHQMC